MRFFALASVVSAFLLTGCARPGDPVVRTGDEIMVCGQLFHTGAPVVLWTDPGGYDAYRAECRFVADRELPTAAGNNPSPTRYHSYRRNIPDDVKDHVRLYGWDLPMLQEYVDLFLIHYDVCGTSQRCFDVLQDRRGLSVHFMLDLDGTIYQTLDLKERAWHGGTANDRSIGIEIANLGAYGNLDDIKKWYARDEKGRLYVTIPDPDGDGQVGYTPNAGIRTPNFVAHPSAPEPVCGTIQNRQLCQYDFTEQQYDSLTRLTATLCRVFPKIRCDYPRDAEGKLRMTTLAPEEMADFSGLLGHWHVIDAKVDPGPAFAWDRLVRDARRLLGRG